MSATPRPTSWLLMASIVAAALLIPLMNADDSDRGSTPMWVRAESRAPAGAAGGTPPVLAFRYRGKLCGTRGCLAETIVTLCQSAQVDRVLERIEPLGGTIGGKGFRGVEATLVAIPSGKVGQTEPTIGQLASVPFSPERVWEWSGALPGWPNSCRSVSI